MRHTFTAVGFEAVRDAMTTVGEQTRNEGVRFLATWKAEVARKRRRQPQEPPHLRCHIATRQGRRDVTAHSADGALCELKNVVVEQLLLMSSVRTSLHL